MAMIRQAAAMLVTAAALVACSATSGAPENATTPSASAESADAASARLDQYLAACPPSWAPITTVLSNLDQGKPDNIAVVARALTELLK